MKDRATPIYFLYLWLLAFAFIPFLMVLFTSFLTQDIKTLASLPFTLENFKELLNPVFFKIAFRSLMTGLAATLICLLFAYPFSYILVKSKHQSLLMLLILIPFWTSSLVRTYSLLAILKFNGLINVLLLKMHLIETPLKLLYSNFAVMSGLVYNLFPFMVLPIFNNMERFDFRLIEAAKDLGASRFALFWRVFLPNTKAGIIAGCALVFLPAMTLFYIPKILGGARSVLLGNLIQNEFLVVENWPGGSAASALLTVSFLILLAIVKRPRAEDLQ